MAMKILLSLVLSYLIGSIPTAYILGKILKGIDIRKFGSGNIGATNAFRVLGKRTGITVLILDILKGFLVTSILGDYLVSNGYLSPFLSRIILGLVCVLGHVYTIFLRFKGGKGVATTLGVFLGLSLKTECLSWVLLMVILTWLIIFLFSHIVSLSSIVSAVLFPIYVYLFCNAQEIIFFSFIFSLFIVLRHKENIKRLISKEEKPIF